VSTEGEGSGKEQVELAQKSVTVRNAPKTAENGSAASNEIILKKNGSNVTRKLFQATGPPDLLSKIISKMDAPLGGKKRDNPLPSGSGMGFLL